MADIVQLKENGVSKYLKTHVNAVDGINGELVSTQGDAKISGIKNFTDELQSKGKPVLTNFKVLFDEGQSLKDALHLARVVFGPIIGYSQANQEKNIPFTFNAGRYEGTIIRDCKLHFNFNCKVHGGGTDDQHTDYAYFNLDTGKETATTSGRMIGAVGAPADKKIALQNMIPLQGIASFKKGDKFSITLSSREGKKLFALQLMQGYIEEVF
ncbi:hypothetical protein [Melissococcus plutonius]|uniref:hypothetical protein n=3 Tax=Melissococcus plutonius TaxID=33970 RepID=UPI0021E55D30|nr:hypothetical protein [Melissococcus plutonius]MCV2499000.1 hypothetical protein [Melissococcus plutonius]MCV2507627.1 hypothetical protein [Melissococcus plutonius]MCV2519981.1 hypothetical protein [Melissococcus plutonius]MCV2528130.1 hypothetical protein [Melissococcus plutonius]